MAPTSTSQKSYETLTTRFSNGVDLVNTWLDYNPSNVKIKKITLTALVATLKNANKAVDDTLEILGNKQKERLLKTFTQRDAGNIINPACLEERIIGVHNYLKGEDVPPATLAALARIIKSIRPKYIKPADANAKMPPSPSEKTYASMTGKGHAIINRITGLGTSYNPPDPDLTVANLTALITAIEALNKDVQIALDDYGTANRARKKLFGKQGGLAEVIPMVKGYNSSFPGHKKADHYIEFNDAIKGT